MSVCPKTNLSYDGDDCEDCEYHVFDYRGLRCNYEEKVGGEKDEK